MSARISPAATARSSKAPTALVRRSNEKAVSSDELCTASASAADMPFLVATNSTLDRSQRRKASTGVGLALQRFGQFAELLHLAPIDRLEQRLARREVAIERPDADPGPFRHGLQARLRAAGAEHGLRSLQHALAIADRVGAGPANQLLRKDLPSHFVLITILLPLAASSIPSRCWSMIFSKNPLHFSRSYGGRALLENGGCLRICRQASSREPARRSPCGGCALILTIALIGALHEPLHQPHRERRAAGRRA